MLANFKDLREAKNKYLNLEEEKSGEHKSSLDEAMEEEKKEDENVRAS
jgi:hypothetical protein